MATFGFMSILVALIVGCFLGYFIAALMMAARSNSYDLDNANARAMQYHQDSKHWEREFLRVKSELAVATRLQQYWRSRCMSEWQAQSSYPDIKIENKPHKEAV